MRILFVIPVLTFLQGTVAGDLVVGSCGRSEYYIEKISCDVAFVIGMNASSDAFADCPDLYDDAHDCFKTKILDRCFEDEDMGKYNETLIFLEEEFGDEDHFCVDGLLTSMENVMRTVNLSLCSGPGASLNYVEFEGRFRDAFREEFKKPVVNFTRLRREYSVAKIDQSLVATACRIPYTDKTLHFHDPLEFNPYDAKALDAANEVIIKFEGGGDIEEKDTTALTVALVILVIVIIIAGIFFYLWRRDKSRAEIRRRKRESRKAQSPSEKNGDAEMQNLSGAAVMQTSDEVGSA